MHAAFSQNLDRAFHNICSELQKFFFIFSLNPSFWLILFFFAFRYWYDKSTALEVDQRVQKILFLFACTNSCANPIVYGIFNIRARRRNTHQVRLRVNGYVTSRSRCSIPPPITAETRLSPLEISLRSLE